MKKLLNILLILLLGQSFLPAQSCYIQLDDASGFDTSPYLSELESAACALRSSFPEALRDSFAVYDFGFYLHHGDYEGGVEKVFQDKIDEIVGLSKYYLAFGKELRGNNLLVRIEYNLPQTDFFSCFESEDLAYIASSLNAISRRVGAQVNFSAEDYSTVFISTMKTLNDFVVKAEECCILDPLKSMTESCSLCPTDINNFRTMLDDNGFMGIPVESFNHTAKLDTSGVVKEYAEMEFQFKGQLIHVNDDLVDFLEMLSIKIQGVNGGIFYYDVDVPYCRDILTLAAGGYGSSIPSFDSSNESKSKQASEEDNVISVIVIGSTDPEGESWIHVKVNVATNEVQTGKTIYLQGLSNCCLDMQTVKSELIDFYSLIGGYVKRKNYGPADTIPINPPVEVVNYLYPHQVKNHVLVLFGQPSQLINMVQNDYKELNDNWAYQTNENIGLNDNTEICAIIQDGILEFGSRNLCIVRADLSPYLDLWKSSNDIELLAAFLAFHATGHSAGINHVADENGPLERGANNYMSSGGCILSHYFGKSGISAKKCKWYPPFEREHLPDDEKYYQSLKQLVGALHHSNYAEDWNSVLNTYIKEALYKRFVLSY